MMRGTFIKSVFSILLTVLISFQGLAQVQKAVAASGTLIKTELIGTYDQTKLTKVVNEELKDFLTGSPMPFEDFKGKFDVPKNSLKLYKLTYQSRIPERGNKPTVATGLVAIPDVIKPVMPIVSYQHGTVFGHDQVPSQPDNSMETKLMLTQFGGQGYIVIGADYIGLGDSKEPNSYFCRRSTEEACMGMYKAAMQFLTKMKVQTGPFFTMGWSQGGYNNMIFLRQLEQAGIPVTASVSCSAPVDLNFFISRGVGNPRPIDAFYTPPSFTNLLCAFEKYYGLTGLVNKAVRPEYVKLAWDFYEFRIDFMEYLKKSSTKVGEVIRQDFIDQLLAGTSPITKLLNDAEGYRWVSKTPLRNYYGLMDEAVPEYLAHLAIDYQLLLGKKNGTAINAGEKADHRNTYIYGLIDAKPWFDSFIKY